MHTVSDFCSCLAIRAILLLEFNFLLLDNAASLHIFNFFLVLVARFLLGFVISADLNIHI